MANPVTRKSVDAQAATGAGSDVRSLGHYHTTLFVVARNLDAANDTVDVSLEGSPDRTHWASLKSVSASDFEQDPDSGAYVATVGLTGRYVEHLRANVTGFTDSADGDLEVDAWVMTGGNAGQGNRGTQRSGPADS